MTSHAPVKNPVIFMKMSLDSAAKVLFVIYSAVNETRDKITTCSETSSSVIILYLASMIFPSPINSLQKKNLFLRFFDAFYVT